jgi:hypothetical protein
VLTPEWKNSSSIRGKTIRDLQVYRDAAQQGTVVSRLGARGRAAALEIEALFSELVRYRETEAAKSRRQKAENE